MFDFLDCSGIGYALAREFLKAGDNVVICSRSGKNKSLIVVLKTFFWSLCVTKKQSNKCG